MKTTYLLKQGQIHTLELHVWIIFLKEKAMQTQHYLIFFLTFACDSTSSKRRPVPVSAQV